GVRVQRRSAWAHDCACSRKPRAESCGGGASWPTAAGARIELREAGRPPPQPSPAGGGGSQGSAQLPAGRVAAPPPRAGRESGFGATCQLATLPPPPPRAGEGVRVRRNLSAGRVAAPPPPAGEGARVGATCQLAALPPLAAGAGVRVRHNRSAGRVAAPSPACWAG